MADVLEAYKRELASAQEYKALRLLEGVQARLDAGEDPATAPPAKKPPPFVACLLCRQSKAKCVISLPGSGQCDRCRAAGCQCKIEAHKRGRKRVRGLDHPRAESSGASPSQSFSPQYHLPNEPNPTSPLAPGSGGPAVFSAPAVPEQQHRGQLPSPGVSRALSRSEDDDDTEVVEPSSANHSTAHPLPFISGSFRPFSIQRMLDPSPGASGTAATSGSAPTRRTAQATGDAIQRGIVSVEMAEQLWTFFFDRLNIIILLFDPNLHTFSYVRQRSGFLFTAILSAAAKFVAPSLSPVLTQLALEHHVQAILGSRRTVETIQAWMIIYMWKSPNDNRAWMYVGLAARTGVELGLDCTPLSDGPEATEVQQRERRNLARTWMLAFMMDRAMASATGRDWSVRGRDPIVRNPRAFSDHPHRIHGDAVIAGFTELRVIASEAMDLLAPPQAAPKQPASIDVARELLSINYDLAAWLEFWKGETKRFNQPPLHIALLQFFGLHVQLTLNTFGMRATRGLPDDAERTVKAEKLCHSLAVESLAQLRLIHFLDPSILHHMQDSVSIMVAYAACFLRKLVNSIHFTDAERLEAIMLISQTSNMFNEATKRPDDTSALQAKFLQSLAAHSQADSRSSHPAPRTSLNAIASISAQQDQPSPASVGQQTVASDDTRHAQLLQEFASQPRSSATEPPSTFSFGQAGASAAQDGLGGSLFPDFPTWNANLGTAGGFDLDELTSASNGTNVGLAALIPQSWGNGIDLSSLGSMEWDQMAEWLYLPNQL